METPATETSDATDDRQTDIKCQQCGLLLAKRNGIGHVDVRWKGLWVLVIGRAVIRCRRCGARSEV